MPDDTLPTQLRWAKSREGSHPLYHLIRVYPANGWRALCNHTPSEFWTEIRETIEWSNDRICAVCFDKTLQDIAADLFTRGDDGTAATQQPGAATPGGRPETP